MALDRAQGCLGLLEQCQHGRDERQSESSCVFNVSLERTGTQLDVGGKRGVRDDFKVSLASIARRMEVPL